MSHLEFRLSLVELAVAHGTIASLHQISSMCSEFILECRSYSEGRGLSAEALDLFSLAVRDFERALASRNLLYIRRARARALRVVQYLKRDGSLVRTERYENDYLPDWLRPAH